MSKDKNLMKTSRNQSISFLKGLAIFIVVMNHTAGLIQPVNEHFWILFYLTVPMFIIVAGYNSYGSYQRKCKQKKYRYQYFDFTDLKQYLLPLLFSYSICTALYQILTTRFFDLGIFFDNLLNFRDPAPMYYLLIFFSLCFVRQPICALVYRICTDFAKRKRIFILVAFLIISCIVSLVLFYFTHVPIGRAGWPSQYLFGGQYYFLFTLGVSFSAYLPTLKSYFKNLVILRVVGGMCLVLSAILYVNIARSTSFPLQVLQDNPPGLIFQLMTIGIFLIFINIPFRKKIANITVKPFAILAEYSWIIYLYHVFLIYIMDKLIIHFNFNLFYDTQGILRYFILLFIPAIICTCCIFGKKLHIFLKKKVMSL